MSDANHPSDVYRAIIDQLVNETRRGGSSEHVVTDGIFSKAPAHAEFNAFISTLTPSQRAVLSRMLQDERSGAIHDVLAVLSWWIDCREVGLTYQGRPMPVDESGMGLHGDYMGLCEGWEWPEST